MGYNQHTPTGDRKLIFSDSKMNWLDLYNFLNKQANETKNIGKFPWQEEVKVFDFGTLGYFPTDFIEMPNGKISFSVDTNQLENINGSGN